ncbi:hypothetical protein D9V37_16475 [Nocardioides mangrovicus]|uniref:Glycosyltransferase RgtA/B/C/D-like domain-containing protein n=1 Tax=Nocardioides mangrovicus TaxID=2478913 RepID=A0A3L8P047_9ACTN|nr:hypothetical protein [Nocardioides mangrovicus]RLV47738.1 hypothetical protein D9V37_16475 [Nocardioides mangrovicus]
MTTTLALRTTVASPPVRRTLPVAVLGLAVLTVLLRLPYLASPVSSDEAGFAMLARQWASGHGSLYGGFWVDRPPLLVALYALADVGGLVGLRVLGCLAAAVTVLGVGLAVDHVSGRRPAAWAAAVACVGLSVPALGGVNVDGELLGVPFVAIGAWLLLRAVTTPAGAWPAVAAGACAAAAVLVKQNFVDVTVLAAVLAVAMRHRATLRLWLRFGAGGIATATLVLGGAALLGTRPWGVLYAMYPFRFRATALLGREGFPGRGPHLLALAGSWATSLLPLLLLALLVAVVLRRTRHAPLGIALLALAAYDLFSVAAGSSYWMHYLVQLVPVTAMAAGLVAPLRPGRLLTAVVLVLASLSYVAALPHRVQAPGVVVGRAIGDVAAPGDTLVSVFGGPEVAATAGLDSPYRYLWSLPAHVLDPGAAGLGRLLAGPAAPTWLVVREGGTVAALAEGPAGSPLRTRYHLVDDLCGRLVYLRDDADRGAPAAAVTDCRLPLSPYVGSLLGTPSSVSLERPRSRSVP